MAVIPQSSGSVIGNLILDATTSETHRKTNSVTDHPVEEGAVVTDHIQRQPEEIEIVGLVTDDPVIWLASLFARSPIADDITVPPNRADLAYAELRRAMDDGDLVTVVTSLREYENMVITSLSVPKDATTGNAVQLRISLREVIKVESKEVAAPTPISSAATAPTDTGKATPKPAGDETSGRTSTVADDIAGFFLD